MNALATVFALAKNDIAKQKRRLGVAFILSMIAALSLLFAIGFATASLTIWLAQTQGLIVALFVTASMFLSVSALAIITNFFYQRRQRRKLAQSASLRGVAMANMFEATRESKFAKAAALAVVGLVVAQQVMQNNDTDQA